MGEEITKLALECLKIDLERHRMKEERLRVREEANKMMMETFKDLSPEISQFIMTLIDSEGEVPPETFNDLPKEMPSFIGKLDLIHDFLESAKTISDAALESLIADLQKLMDKRGG